MPVNDKNIQGRSKSAAHRGAGKIPSSLPERSSDWFFSELIESLPIGIIILDLLNEQIVKRNQSATALFEQYPRANGYHFYEKLFLSEFLKNERPQPAHKGASRHLQYGQLKLGYTVHSIEGGYVCVFVQDITQKARERHIHQVKLENSSWEYLLFSFRQELGGPLSRLKMILKELQAQSGETSQGYLRERINKGLSELSRAENLLHRLFVLGQPGQLKITPVDLNEVVCRFLTGIEPHLQRKKILLKKVFADPGVYVAIDHMAFQQVLSHLFDNAIDALEGAPNPQIVVNLFRTDQFVLLKIEDNGCGIPEIFMDKIFHPFYSMKPGSLGFGLTLSRKLLAGMQGALSLKSIPDVGTIAEINLPVCSESQLG